MSNTQSPNRRSFLKLGLAGAATGVIAPHVWIPRISKAAMEVPSHKDNHLIIINLDGGARSVPMFNAKVSPMWNPIGMQPGAPGTEWGIGSMFSAVPYIDASMTLPVPILSLPEISNQICVIGTMDHTPGEVVGDGNHDSVRPRMATGSPNGGAGLLSLIHGHHKKYTQPSLDPAFPPVIIDTFGSTAFFGIPRGPAVSPVMIPSFSEFKQQNGDNAGGQPDFARALESGIDGHAAARRSARDRALIDRLRNGKVAVQAFRDVFLNPVLDVVGQPAATMHGLTNQQLVAGLGDSDTSLNMALALRFLGFGSAAIMVGDLGWDTHSNESTVYAMMAERLARVLAGLNVVLKLLQHPAGGTYWDHSVVMVVSEMGRDNILSNGYNSGGGSDHNGGPGSRYQAFPFMGGLISQGGKMFGTTNAQTMEPDDVVFGTQSLLATSLALLNIDPGPHIPADPLVEIF